jgi:hypothetical protein
MWILVKDSEDVDASRKFEALAGFVKPLVQREHQLMMMMKSS